MKSKLIQLFISAAFVVCCSTIAVAHAATDPIVVAKVFGAPIVADSVGIHFDADNKPILPDDKHLPHGMANPVDELIMAALRFVEQDYLVKHHLLSTDSEAQEFQRYEVATMTKKIAEQKTQLELLESRLKDTTMAANDKEQYQRHLEMYRQQIGDQEGGLAMQQGMDAEQSRMTYGSEIEKWKFYLAIYKQYGGEVEDTKFGPVPIVSIQRLLQEAEKKQDLQIADTTIQKAFWKRLLVPPVKTVAAEKVDFTPYWKK